uniref:Mannitol 1-phosphate dehydrogenase n=1 Tax=Ganoderma boninense TaxID=34458 RepID=A0A5K1K7N1_9APHY|nr:Mannitol 1-phosphate dehydrogenase [Ganoderma boninense]
MPFQDMFYYNAVAARAVDASRDARLTAGRVYLIDFESCQQFEHGPGVQTAVPLPNTQVPPPLDMKSFDPYSWDVFCLGETLEFMFESKFLHAPAEGLPWIPRLCLLSFDGLQAWESSSPQ